VIRTPHGVALGPGRRPATTRATSARWRGSPIAAVAAVAFRPARSTPLGARRRRRPGAARRGRKAARCSATAGAASYERRSPLRACSASSRTRWPASSQSLRSSCIFAFDTGRPASRFARCCLTSASHASRAALSLAPEISSSSIAFDCIVRKPRHRRARQQSADGLGQSRALARRRSPRPTTPCRPPGARWSWWAAATSRARGKPVARRSRPSDVARPFPNRSPADPRAAEKRRRASHRCETLLFPGGAKGDRTP
jgi:hypothetical protein